MSKWSHFWKRVLGGDSYEAVKEGVIEGLRVVLKTKVRAWLVGRLERAGVEAEDAEAISYEVIGRALAALDE
jgi:hypothetical protein